MHIICIDQIHIKLHHLLHVTKMANSLRLHWCILMFIDICVYMRRMFPGPFLAISKCEHRKHDSEDEEEAEFLVPVTPHPSINEDRDWIQISDTV